MDEQVEHDVCVVGRPVSGFPRVFQYVVPEAFLYRGHVQFVPRHLQVHIFIGQVVRDAVSFETHTMRGIRSIIHQFVFQYGFRHFFQEYVHGQFYARFPEAVYALVHAHCHGHDVRVQVKLVHFLVGILVSAEVNAQFGKARHESVYAVFMDKFVGTLLFLFGPGQHQECCRGRVPQGSFLPFRCFLVRIAVSYDEFAEIHRVQSGEFFF